MNFSWSTISKVSSCLGAIVLMSLRLAQLCRGPAAGGGGGRGSGTA